MTLFLIKLSEWSKTPMADDLSKRLNHLRVRHLLTSVYWRIYAGSLIQMHFCKTNMLVMFDLFKLTYSSTSGSIVVSTVYEYSIMLFSAT